MQTTNLITLCHRLQSLCNEENCRVNKEDIIWPYPSTQAFGMACLADECAVISVIWYQKRICRDCRPLWHTHVLTYVTHNSKGLALAHSCSRSQSESVLSNMWPPCNPTSRHLPRAGQMLTAVELLGPVTLSMHIYPREICISRRTQCLHAIRII